MSWFSFLKMNRIICLVGMCGSGKTAVSDILKEKGFRYVRFGDLTDEVVLGKRPELAEKIRIQVPAELNEANERKVREGLRRIYGMDAYAKLNLAKFDEMLEQGNLVADGLYSWEEYKTLKEHFGKKMMIVAVLASPAVRYKRLANREVRPLALEESKSRDYAEIENLNKGGPIAMADYYIVNNFSFEFLQKEIENFTGWLKNAKA